jgi:D-serine deaminase-like pyridoxal phosphate-dependent protein
MSAALAATRPAVSLVELASDTPEVVVDLGVVRANVKRAAAIAAAAGKALRPHAKTHKLPQLARLQLDAGAVGIQVAKLGEAEVMVDAGIEDVLVGYPVVGAVKLARLIALAERARISVSLDSLEVAEGISAAAANAGVEVALLIEIDTGLRRLGQAPGKPAADLAEQVAALPGVRLAGVFTHEGHVYAAQGDAELKERLTREACALTVETAEQIRERGIPVETVSVGSAGTFRFAVNCPGVTEVRPGTYVFNDRSQLAQGAATEADVAAFVVTTVVSRPTPDRVVVDAGSKVMTSDRMLMADPPASFGRVIGHDDWDLVRLSEEHGVIDVPPSAEVSIGDRLLVMPNHICPVINLANQLTIVENGVVLDHWPVASRGRVQ